MRSLFILSLPRSLSSQAHAACCAALGLAAPGWTSDGEVLNLDRHGMALGAAGAKYTTPADPGRFAALGAFLSAVVGPTGGCCKDVVQPFAAAAWLRAHPEIAVLKIGPDVAHVAERMIERGWLYPTTVAHPGARGVAERMVSGLRRAAAALDAVPGETVPFHALAEGAEALRPALARLYPDAPVGPLAFDPSVAAGGAAARRRWDGAAYRELQALTATLGTAA